MADILVVGSVAWDEVVHLAAPIRPGSHNEARWQGKRIGGGAANTALALARAGDRVRVVSAVGADLDGERLRNDLARLGVDVTYLDGGAHETTRSLVMLDPAGERTIVNLARAEVPLPRELATLDTDCVYVRSADPALTPMLAECARRGPVLAHVPPVKADFRPAQVLVGSASDLDASFLASPFQAGRHIAGQVLEWIVITDGENGAVAYGRDETIRQVADAVRVVDSTGAGDVFAAGLAHAMARALPMREALATAVRWGTLSVRYRGTVPPPAFPDLADEV